MTELEKRNLFGVIENDDFIFDAISGKLTILTNNATENGILSSMALGSKQILKEDGNFYFRQLINTVEVGTYVTVLPNGIFADSRIEKIVVPKTVTTLLGYAMCSSQIDTIVFEGDNISLGVAEGLLSWCSPYQESGTIDIICNDKIKAALIHDLKLITADSEDTIESISINGKKISEMTEADKEKAELDFNYLKPNVPDYIFEMTYYELKPYSENVRDHYYDYLSKYKTKPFLVRSTNFAFDSLTGEFTIIGDNLREDEITATMAMVNEEIKQQLLKNKIEMKPEDKIDIKELTTSMNFLGAVTMCPPTAFSEYRNLQLVDLPEGIKHMGINSFVYAGGHHHQFTIIIRNPSFSFNESPKAINKTGLENDSDIGPSTVKIYYADGVISDEDLSWVMPCLINEEFKGRVNLEIYPLSSYDIGDTKGKGGYIL